MNNLEIVAGEIQEYCDETISEDPNECVERGLKLVTYQSNTAKMLADAKYHQDIAKNNSVRKNIAMNLSPSILKTLIESDSEKENYLVNWIDRINRTITNQVEFLRTVISKAKAEQYNNRPMN